MYLDKPSKEDPKIKKKRKPLKDYFDFRNNQKNQIGLILFLAFVISTSLHYAFELRFTEKLWKTEPMARYKIVDDLIESEMLLNQSKPNVIKRLGEPSWILTKEKDIMLYDIGLSPVLNDNQVEHLYIEFINEIVIKVSLAIYDYK